MVIIDSMNRLYLDCWLYIFQYLRHHDVYSMLRTNKSNYNTSILLGSYLDLRYPGPKRRLCDWTDIHLAAELGYLEVVQWFHRNSSDSDEFDEKVMDKAAKSGNLDLMKWLYSNRAEGCTISAIKYAIEFGYLDMMKWLYKTIKPRYIPEKWLPLAICNGYLEVAKWLHDEKHVRIKNGIFFSIRSHNFRVAQWIVGQGITFHLHIINRATVKGNLEVLKWLHGIGYSPQPEAIPRAILTNDLDIIKWYYRICWDDSYAHVSPHIMDLEIAQWLHAHGIILGSHIADNMVSQGNIEGLKWAYSISLRCGRSARISIATKGYIDMAKWLLQHGMSFSIDYISYAAAHDQLDVIKWLHKNASDNIINTHMTTSSIKVAQWLYTHNYLSSLSLRVSDIKDHYDIVRWLIDQRFHFTSLEIEDAIYMGNFRIVKLLLSRGYKVRYDSATYVAASNGHLDILKLLHAYGYPCSAIAMTYAAAGNHLHVVKWLHYTGNGQCNHHAIRMAAKYGYLKMVKWLYTNRPEIQHINVICRAAKYGHLEMVKWIYYNRPSDSINLAIDLALVHDHIEIYGWLSTRIICTT